jgi:hypothetical protein
MISVAACPSKIHPAVDKREMVNKFANCIGGTWVLLILSGQNNSLKNVSFPVEFT